MYNSAGGIIGIRLRRPNGFKFSVTGSRSGIFLPVDTPWSGTLLITEGPTDCGAMLDLGFSCIGRPDALSCIGIVAELVRQRGYNNVVVVGDDDAPGQRGAESLASTLRAISKNVRIIFPPNGVKDAREWKGCGATRADVEAAINHAPYLRMAVKAVLCA
jgi:DNA primase